MGELLSALLAAALSSVSLAFGATDNTTRFVSASIPVRQGQPCRTLWSGAQARRAIKIAYHGTRNVTRRDVKYLALVIRCQHNPALSPLLRGFAKRARHAWWLRCHPPMYTQLASWYNDGGGTACGFHAVYGVANKTLPCGTKLLIRYHGRQVQGVVQDRGPYVGGRIWDLNQNTAGALGFGGVDYVQVSVNGA